MSNQAVFVATCDAEKACMSYTNEKNVFVVNVRHGDKNAATFTIKNADGHTVFVGGYKEVQAHDIHSNLYVACAAVERALYKLGPYGSLLDSIPQL